MKEIGLLIGMILFSDSFDGWIDAGVRRYAYEGLKLIIRSRVLN